MNSEETLVLLRDMRKEMTAGFATLGGKVDNVNARLAVVEDRSNRTERMAERAETRSLWGALGAFVGGIFTSAAAMFWKS